MAGTGHPHPQSGLRWGDTGFRPFYLLAAVFQIIPWPCYVRRRTEAVASIRYVCAQNSGAPALARKSAAGVLPFVTKALARWTIAFIASVQSPAHPPCMIGRRDGAAPRTARRSRIQDNVPCPITKEIRRGRSTRPLAATFRKAPAVCAHQQLPDCSAGGQPRSSYSPWRSPLRSWAGNLPGVRRISTSNRNSMLA
jgi:hypothetical protein